MKNGITIMYHDFRGHMFQVSVTIPREIPHQTESSSQVTSYMRALSLVWFLLHKCTEVVSLLVSLVLSTSIYTFLLGGIVSNMAPLLLWSVYILMLICTFTWAAQNFVNVTDCPKDANEWELRSKMKKC